MPEAALETGGNNAENALPLKLEGALPRKRRINLAKVTRKKIKWYLIIPAVIAVIFLCRAFAQHGVTERFDALRTARNNLQIAQMKFDDAQRTLDEYYQTRDIYVHVTWSDMTAEEKALVDPLDVIALLERFIMPVSTMDSWSIANNSVSVTVTCESLVAINDLVNRLRAEPMVDYCTMNGGSRENAESGVTASFTISFKNVGNGGGNAGG